MASCTALPTHPLPSQNILGQQTTSGFRGCQGLLFNDILEFLKASVYILLFRSSIHEALTTTVVVQDLQHVLWAQFIAIQFDIVTDVFVLMLCFPWKDKCVRENFTDFFPVLKMHEFLRIWGIEGIQSSTLKVLKTANYWRYSKQQILLSWKFWMRSLASLHPMGYKKSCFKSIFMETFGTWEYLGHAVATVDNLEYFWKSSISNCCFVQSNFVFLFSKVLANM